MSSTLFSIEETNEVRGRIKSTRVGGGLMVMRGTVLRASSALNGSSSNATS